MYDWLISRNVYFVEPIMIRIRKCCITILHMILFFSYTFSDWFNTWLDSPFNQSAWSSHGIGHYLLKINEKKVNQPPQICLSIYVTPIKQFYFLGPIITSGSYDYVQRAITYWCSKEDFNWPWNDRWGFTSLHTLSQWTVINILTFIMFSHINHVEYMTAIMCVHHSPGINTVMFNDAPWYAGVYAKWHESLLKMFEDPWSQ